MRILLIEPDSATAARIESVLKSKHLHVYTTDCGEKGMGFAGAYDYDLIMTELNLPDMSGCDVVRRCRDSKINTPVLILSSVSCVEEKIHCLNLGADDYITKPFHEDEMVARINAIARRFRGYSGSVVLHGELVVDLSKKNVSVAGDQVPLTRREYQIFEVLFLRKNFTLSKERIFELIYGDRDLSHRDVNYVGLAIWRIRKKLYKLGVSKSYIETVWGMGYTIGKMTTA